MKEETKKAKYEKPELVKHKKLTEVIRGLLESAGQ